MSHEYGSAFCGRRATTAQISNNRFAYVRRQRKPLLPIALSANDELAGTPVDIIQLHVDHFTGSHSKSH
jgi:hypothetical protein